MELVVAILKHVCGILFRGLVTVFHKMGNLTRCKGDVVSCDLKRKTTYSRRQTVLVHE